MVNVIQCLCTVTVVIRGFLNCRTDFVYVQFVGSYLEISHRRRFGNF
jgi:hypothetical protein